MVILRPFGAQDEPSGQIKKNPPMAHLNTLSMDGQILLPVSRGLSEMRYERCLWVCAGI